MSVISKLTNGEILHNIIPAVRDRIDHLSDMVSLSTLYTLLEDSEGFQEASALISRLEEKGQNCITYLDAETNKVTTIAVKVEDNMIKYYNTYAAGGNTYVAILDDIVGQIKDTGEGILEFTGDWIFKTADKTSTLLMDKISSNVVDQLTLYEMIETIATSVITNGKVVAADIMASVRNRTTGVRGVAKNFLDTINSALSASNVTSVVSVIKQYLTNPGAQVNSDGTWSFSQDYVTKDWMTTTIISGLTNLVSTLGTVLAGLGNVAGFVLAGVGTLFSGVVNYLSNTASTDTNVVCEQTEGREIAFPLMRATVTSPTVHRQYLAELLDGKGPQHVEFGPISGYIWNEDPNDLNVEDSDQSVYAELYPSSRSFLPTAALCDFINDHFSRTVEFYVSPITALHYFNLLGKVKVEYSAEDLLSFYRNNCEYPDWDSYTDTQRTDVAATCIFNGIAFLGLLLHVGKQAGEQVYNQDNLIGSFPSVQDDSWDDFINRFTLFDWYIPEENNDDYQGSNGLPGEMSWTYLTEMAVAKSVHQDDTWTHFTSSTISYMSRFFDSLNTSSYNYQRYFLVPFSYIVEVRYPLHIIPPKYDRSSFVVGVILTSAITVIAIAGAIIATTKIKKWRQKQQLKTQLKTEAAWAAATQNPTPENINAYRKAALKQNTIGKIFGCSSVSNTNYWGGGDDSLTPDGRIDQVLMRIG